jgi:hypothetical protein
MVGVEVRRLAAIDMYGSRGSMRRRRILGEFVLGALALVALGIRSLAHVPGSGGVLFGLWVLGIGANYLPLACPAIALNRPGALAAELDGVDTGRELRRYSLLQFWIFVPLSLVVLALRQRVTS